MGIISRSNMIGLAMVGVLLVGCASTPVPTAQAGTSAGPTVPIPSGAVPLAAGGGHTCVVIPAGGVKCWGDNASGELGDGTNADRRTPVDVVGLSSGVTALSAGISHTCAVTSTGGVKCWGGNVFGDLGDGTTTERDAPVDVSGLASGVRTIVSGADHTCALTDQGAVLCWGSNDVGQLGDGTTTDHPVPVSVAGLESGVVALAAGDYYTCALTGSGKVECWGNNVAGQLAGDGTPVAGMNATPVEVPGLNGNAAALAAGKTHTCALTAQGEVLCWGLNDQGQLGDGTTADRHALVNVRGLSGGVIALAAGNNHTCALTTGGGVHCWGSNQYGELGDGTTTERHAPVAVSGAVSGFVAVAAGMDHTCTLNGTGAVFCWGRNNLGQLGDGSTSDRSTPVQVAGIGP
jgi:alpha-tubulin suppressor-like RCC1 family protein